MKVGQGTYGNRKSGKTFSYFVPDNARQGQKFRVEAYSQRARRVVQTMWTLAASPVVTQGGRGYGAETIERQKARVDAETGEKGTNLRTVLDANTLELPGGQKYQQIAKERGLSDTQAKSLWALNSNIQNLQGRDLDANNSAKARDILLGFNHKQDNTAAAGRILGG